MYPPHISYQSCCLLTPSLALLPSRDYLGLHHGIRNDNSNLIIRDSVIQEVEDINESVSTLPSGITCTKNSV